VYSPKEALKLFRLVDGYHMELVASEPIVQDPVAIDFDADGRMYVVEMRGFMPNLQGIGEDQPVGRIVVAEDTDGDGIMDKSTIFADSLVLPRAVKVLEHGVLVGAPPNLWLMRDTTGDLRADTRELIRDDFGDPKGNPEHNANGLFWGIDNWIHTANYPGQFRVGPDGKIVFRKTVDEGQWGVAADDYGRLYRNSNEDPLRADLIASHYAMRNATLPSLRGVYERLTANIAVWPDHKTPAINRGYRDITMRKDSSLAHYTSAGSPTPYVGDRLPAELKGSVFVTESAGNLVGRLIVSERDAGFPTAQTAYDHKEFLTSTDQRFRPVNLANAPDGTLYVVDMYRGIVQHRVFITGYLEQKIRERGMEQPIGLGRIWRIAHTSTTPGERPRLSAKRPSELVPYLAHPSAWWRLTAQRLLVERHDSSVAPALRTMARTHADDRARLHALWTLDGLGAADQALLTAALRDSSPHVRAAAIRIAEPILARGDAAFQTAAMRLIGDPDPTVRRQLAASIGEVPPATRADALLIVTERDGEDPIIADLVVSGLSGRELPFLERVLALKAEEPERLGATVRSLSRAIVTSGNPAGVQRMLTLAGETSRARWQRLALLDGARRPAGQQGGVVVKLGTKPVGLLATTASADTALRTKALQVAETVTWPGKPVTTPPVKPLTQEEAARFAVGARQYASTCSGCHQALGTGLPGVAKPLVGSPLALGPPERVVRIVLHGKEGAMLMPPLGGTLTDDQIAAVLTFVRRSWGNTASPIDAAEVKEIRGNTMGRNKPWTEDELKRVRR
jgi:mono/diheme cytochrome c family protein/glucose/arabinose dehydrogenase